MEAQAPPSQSPAAFFDDLERTWREAAASAGGVETRRFDLAGQAVELRFAGGALVAPLTRALAHLPVAALTESPLAIYAWESETTGVPVPPAPWGADDYREYGKIRGFFDERFQSVFQWGSHSLVMLDLERSEAIYWVGAAAQIPHFEMAAPLRLLLHGWLRTRGVELVHAAAVGSGSSCVLLVGKAGSGKSWATLASTESGLRMIADDYCLLCPGTPPHIASVYSSAKAHADAAGRLSFLDGLAANPTRPDDDKAVYFLQETAPERLLQQADLNAILIPRRVGTGGARLSPATAAAALAALAPSTILQLPAAGAQTLQRLAELVSEVPSLYLDVGTELDSIGPAIAPLLDPRAG